jgi:diadenosine tetraphosphatase ApaH/serine/threonine PP2A family protein phosphatase
MLMSLSHHLKKVLEDCKSSSAPDYTNLVPVLKAAEEVLLKEPQVLTLKEPAVITGDLHGDLEAVLRITERYLDSYKLVFLGDYVDRGNFSLETVSYLLALKLMRPERVFLLRGNHESILVNQSYGFYYELARKMSGKAFELLVRFNEVLSTLPYAALLKPYRLLLVHGGIPSTVPSLREIARLPKKDLIPSSEEAFQLLWNDPSEEVEAFSPSDRGEGIYFFGRKPLEEFLRKNKLTGIIRSHEVVEQGYRFSFPATVGKTVLGPKPPRGFKGRVLTVFTSGAYEGVERCVAVVQGKEIKLEQV